DVDGWPGNSVCSPLIIRFFDPVFTVNTKDISFKNNILVYPNPTDDNFTVNNPFSSAELEIHNLLGETILRKKITQSKANFQITLPQGTYIIRIIEEKTNKVYISKLIII
ncbi:MAG: T9SS type A sorting domain-containing protein, partial [Ignavibacteria bacterium]|nr:T9SS type A sorting domain-containing protein [Ignavibacteria bacterium]